METERTSLTAFGRANVAFCEQLAWFALESLERAHRLNMDALEAFWERWVSAAKAAAGVETPAIAHRSAAAAMLLHWARASETVTYLSREFGRLAAEYAAQMRNAVPAEPGPPARRLAASTPQRTGAASELAESLGVADDGARHVVRGQAVRIRLPRTRLRRRTREQA